MFPRKLIFRNVSFSVLCNMSTTGYNTRGKIACVRCKQRHKPPVEASCPGSKAKKGKQTVTENVDQQVVDLGSIDAGGNKASTGASLDSAVPHKATNVSNQRTQTSWTGLAQ